MSRLTGRLNVVYSKFEQLEKERTGHILVYMEPFVYMISGFVNKSNVHSCQKLHLGEKIWTDFASIPFEDNLIAVSGIGFGHSIYVFDSFSQNQRIYKVGPDE